MPVFDSSPEGLIPQIHQIFRNWNVVGGDSEKVLEGLLLVQNQLASLDSSTPEALHLSITKVVHDAMQELSIKDAIGARILRERFLNGHKSLKVANMINLSIDQVNQRQRKALVSLCQIVSGQEQLIRRQRVEALLQSLPPPTYSRLFGFDEAVETVVKSLLDPNVRVVNLIGLGGAGKTSLADAVTRRVLETLHFEQAVWLFIETQSMSGGNRPPELTFQALVEQLAKTLSPDDRVSANPELQVQAALKEKPILVILDNLENLADALYILEHIRTLTDPSKFLLTSRARPPREAVLLTFRVAELSRNDATAFIRHYAGEKGFTELAEAHQEDIDEIYQITGGNPLAIKLVVNLVQDLPWDKVIENFQIPTADQVDDIENMFRRIYWKSWHSLREGAKAVLKAMTLTSEAGATPDHLLGICGLSSSDFWIAINELTERSLVEVSGSMRDRRYVLHGLTRSFIRAEITRWQTDGN